MRPDVVARERLSLDRQWVRDTASCPICHADIGERCHGARVPALQGNHRSRTALAVRFGYRSRPD